jgi:hypothetical protein
MHPQRAGARSPRSRGFSPHYMAVVASRCRAGPAGAGRRAGPSRTFTQPHIPTGTHSHHRHKFPQARIPTRTHSQTHAFPHARIPKHMHSHTHAFPNTCIPTSTHSHTHAFPRARIPAAAEPIGRPPVTRWHKFPPPRLCDSLCVLCEAARRGGGEMLSGAADARRTMPTKRPKCFRRIRSEHARHISTSPRRAGVL